MTNRLDRVWQCPPRAVVAAVGFEPASARAVSLAGFIASACDGTLGVLHADRVDAPSYFTLDQIARLEEARADAGMAVAVELTRFARGATDWPVEVTVVDGTPVEAILHVADHADLLVGVQRLVPDDGDPAQGRRAGLTGPVPAVTLRLTRAA